MVVSPKVACSREVSGSQHCAYFWKGVYCRLVLLRVKLWQEETRGMAISTTAKCYRFLHDLYLWLIYMCSKTPFGVWMFYVFRALLWILEQVCMIHPVFWFSGTRNKDRWQMTQISRLIRFYCCKLRNLGCDMMKQEWWDHHNNCK